MSQPEALPAGGAGPDRPALGAVLELVTTSRRETFLSWMEGRSEDCIVVSAPKDSSMDPVELPLGEQLDLLWSSAGELRSLPVLLVSSDEGEKPCWQLRPVGAVKRGQRRQAVRAPMTVPVDLALETVRIRGTTLDLSEGGVRCVLEMERRSGPPDSAGEVTAARALRVGDVVRLTAELPDLTISCLAEITRDHPRTDDRLELSARFIGLNEHEQDAIRVRVFARLRQLRQRGLL